MLIFALEYVGIVLTCLVVGVLWGTWLSLSRSIETFPIEVFLQIGRRMIKNLAVPMRILMPLTFLTNTGLCVALFRNSERQSGWLVALGVVALAIMIAITLLINVPLDLKIRTWTSDNAPADWQVFRRRWQQYHTIRTFTSLLALVLLVAGVVLRTTS